MNNRNQNNGYPQGYDPARNNGYPQGYDPARNNGYPQGYDPARNNGYPLPRITGIPRAMILPGTTGIPRAMILPGIMDIPRATTITRTMFMDIISKTVIRGLSGTSRTTAGETRGYRRKSFGNIPMPELLPKKRGYGHLFFHRLSLG